MATSPRRFRVLALVAGVGAAVAACGGSTGGTPGSSAGPTAPGSTAGPGSTGGQSGFTCDKPYGSTSGVKTGSSAHITAVTAVTVPGHDELRFAFGSADLPALLMEQVVPPFHDPGGTAISVIGVSYLRLRFTPASMVDDSGNPTDLGPTDLGPNAPSLKQLRLQGESAGVTAWIAGFSGPVCFQVRMEPSTIVVWLQHPG